MKNVLVLLLSSVFLAGCMHNYDLTLVNGKKITHVSKPKLNKETGVYTFKDVKGRTNSISAAKVVEIAPHSSSVKAGTLP
jgi:PBP1b-binding outer membrane lipoprotein LpoB